MLALALTALVLSQKAQQESPWASIGSYKFKQEYPGIELFLPGLLEKFDFSSLNGVRAYSANYDRAIVGTGSELIEVLSAPKNSRRTIGFEPDRVQNIRLLRQPFFLVTSEKQHTSLWSTEDSKPIRRYGDEKTSVFPSNLGMCIASVSGNKVTVIRVSDQALLATYRLPNDHGVSDIQVSEDGLKQVVRTLGSRRFQTLYTYVNGALKPFTATTSVEAIYEEKDRQYPYLSLDGMGYRNISNSIPQMNSFKTGRAMGEETFEVAAAEYEALFPGTTFGLAKLGRVPLSRRIYFSGGFSSGALSPPVERIGLLLNGDVVESMRVRNKPVGWSVLLNESSVPDLIGADSLKKMPLNGGHREAVVDYEIDEVSQRVVTVSLDSVSIWDFSGKLVKRILASDVAQKSFPRVIVGLHGSGTRVWLTTPPSFDDGNQSTIMEVNLNGLKAMLIKPVYKNEFGDVLVMGNVSFQAGDGKAVDFFVDGLPFNIDNTGQRAFRSESSRVPQRVIEQVLRFKSFNLGDPEYVVSSSSNILAAMYRREDGVCHLVIFHADSLAPIVVLAQPLPVIDVRYDKDARTLSVDCGQRIVNWVLRL